MCPPCPPASHPLPFSDLRRGVAIHGEHWNRILNDSSLQFQDRTQVDLKDKWRNIKNYRAYSDTRTDMVHGCSGLTRKLAFRRYMLVDANHEPVLTDSLNPHTFRNRWPIEAATKAATKSFVYAPGQDTAEIYLREVREGPEVEGAAEVHVFEVRRSSVAAADIPKFSGYRTANVGFARKIRTERYLTRQAIEQVLRQ